MFGYIYITTNLINGKKYIGQKQSEVFLGNKYLGSGNAIHNIIKKYGRDVLRVSMIEECNSREELDIREKYWIRYYNAVESPDFYNIAEGGDGGNLVSGLSEEDYQSWRNKVNKDKKGKIKVNDGNKDKFIFPHELDTYLSNGYKKGSCIDRRGSKNPMYGKRLSGSQHWNYGRRGSECPNYGKKYQRHISNYINPCKGRIYITNGTENKMVFENDLNYYLNNGWKRGQTRFNRKD